MRRLSIQSTLIKAFHHCPRCGSEEFAATAPRAKRCFRCGFTFYLNASSAVAAFIERGDGKILLATRAIEPAIGTCDLPGGFVEWNETAEEAIIREVQEETGMRLSSPQYLFSLPNQYDFSGYEIPTLDLFFYFHLTQDQDSSLHANDDVAALQWIDKKELSRKNFGLSSIQRSVSIFLKLDKE